MSRLHNVVSKNNLELANRIINDDVPTMAFEIDPKDEVFNTALT